MVEPRIRYQLSVADAAAQLGLSEGAVRQRIRRGTLEVRRKGRRLLVLLSQSDLDQEQDGVLQRPTASGEAERTMDAVHETSETPEHKAEPKSPRTVRPESTRTTGTGEAMVPQHELERVQRAYDELAEAWAKDLRHQLSRLEREVDRLQSELSEVRKRHAEEMRRKDVLLQGNQEALATWIAQFSGRAPALPSQDSRSDA